MTCLSARRARLHRGRAVLGLLLALAWPAVAMAQAAPPLASGTTAPAGTGFTLDVLAPGEGGTHTAREFVNVLGRTTPGALVQVGGVPVTVFATGVFARDRMNVTAVQTLSRGGVAQMQFTVEVPGIPELARTLVAVRDVDGVIECRRR